MTISRDQWKSPITNEVMRELIIEGVKLHYDDVSGGYWLEDGELSQLAERYGAEVKEVPVEGTGKAIEIESPRLCPEDANTQLREYAFGDSGILLDICPTCDGIWVDGGELKKVIHYMEANSTYSSANTEDIDGGIDFLVMTFVKRLGKRI